MERRFVYLVGLGYSALVALMLAVMLMGFSDLVEINKQLEQIVEHHNRKIEIVTNTQIAGFRRTDSLYNMALEADSFARDAYFLGFNTAGFNVGLERNALFAAKLSEQEMINFNQQSALIEKIIRLQDGVVDKLSANRVDEARKQLITEAVPLHAAFNDALADMRAIQKEATNRAVADAHSVYRRMLNASILIGALAIGVSLFIGVAVYRKLAAQAHAINTTLGTLHVAQKQLYHEATHDHLTGLPNRSLFYDRLALALERGQRNQTNFTLLFLDLNHFKQVNDTYGHHVGDRVLLEVAKRLKSCSRGTDTVARLAGDEFAMLMEECGDSVEILTMIRHLHEAVSHGARIDGHELQISVSIGASIYPQHGTSEEALLKYADEEMYRAKRTRHASIDIST